MSLLGLLFGGLLAAWPARLLSRRLEVQPRFAVTVISAGLFVYLVTVGLGALGLSVTFWSVAAGLILCRLLVGFVRPPLPLLGNTPADFIPPAGDTFRPGPLIQALTATVLLLALYNMVFHPLGGFDTIWRWDRLARLIVRHHTIGFYPPVTDADFTLYPYPDGFALFQPSMVAWLYLAAGKPAPWIAGCWTAVQWLAILSAVRHGAALWADRLGTTAAPKAAVAAAAGAAVLVLGTVIGQETGLTALGTVTAVACLPRTGWRWAVAAGLGAACAGAARDYGPALTLSLIAAAFLIQGLRHSLIVAAVALPIVAVSPLWNLFRTGSPLFGTPAMPAALNPVLHEWLGFYPQYFSLKNISPEDLSRTLWQGLPGVLPVVLLGLLGLWRLSTSPQPWRTRTALLLPVLVTCALWVSSTSYTAGGASYALRVLTPMLAVLALVAGVSVPRRSAAVTLLLLLGLGVCVYRLSTFELTDNRLTLTAQADRVIAAARPRALILSDEPALTCELNDRAIFSGVRALSAWSPAARNIILAPDPAALEAALKAAGVTHVNFHLHVKPAGNTLQLTDYGIHTLWMLQRPAWQQLPTWPVITQVDDVRCIQRLPDALTTPAIPATTQP